ncbi:MAG: D-alanyl-D-alanine carboxypeptidase [Bacteroidales bacterium]
MNLCRHLPAILVFRHASVSICFRDLSTGKVTESLNHEMALGSASVMKLVTAAAALEILGPNILSKQG